MNKQSDYAGNLGASPKERLAEIGRILLAGYRRAQKALDDRGENKACR